MKKAFQIPLCLVALISLVILLGLISNKQTGRQPWENFKAPDDVLVAREELSHRFTGPRYFHFVRLDDVPLTYPYIQAADANAQIGGIVQARSLPPDAAGKIERTVGMLTVRPPSRLTGVDQVNFLQLNLALDQMR